MLMLFFVLFLYLSVCASTVKLEVLSHPSGADIYIDRVWRGTTPQVLYIAPGKHQVRLEKFGYSPAIEDSDIRLSSVSEYNLAPEREITKYFPLVIYLVNYQSSGDRTVLYKEQEQDIIQSLWNRFTNLGFNVTVETPRDEFDLVLDKESIYADIEKKYPQTGLFFFIESLWTFSSFQQKRVTRLETTLKVYDPKSKVTLGTFKDTAESVGQMSPDIVVLEIIERITQDFLDHIGNFIVQIYTRQTNTPIMVSRVNGIDSSSMTIKNLVPIENLEVNDSNANILKSEIETAVDEGINILFVVDRSGSNSKYSEVIKEQVDLILKNLPKKIRWGILAFDDKVEVIQSFTEDYSRWTAVKERITNAGMTRLYDGLYNAAKIVERENGINVIILLTDGIDADYLDSAPGSIKTMKEGIDALKAAGTIVYPIGISEKNYTNFMKDIAMEFGTFYSDAFRHDNSKIATDILQDMLQSIAVVRTKRIDNPSFHINGKKYYLSVNGRNLLNEEMIDTAILKTAYQNLEIPVEERPKTPEATSLTPEISLNEEQIEQGETPEATEIKQPFPEISVQPIFTEPATVTATKPSTPVSKESPQPVLIEAIPPTPAATAATSTEQAKNVVKEPTTIPSTDILSPSDSSVLTPPILWPESYQQALELRFSELFDIDPAGHFIWTERTTGYLWIRNQMKLIGIEFDDTPVAIELYYPYLTILYRDSIETVLIGDGATRLYRHPVAQPVSCLALEQKGLLGVGYKDGLVQVLDISGKKVKEFRIENSSIQQLVFDDQNRLLFSSSPQKIGWVELSYDSLVMSKEMQKPIVGISAFFIDKTRFLVTDAGGDVYYVRFADFSEQKRNLNRGILLQSQFSEEQNQLFSYHWDKTLRVFRVYDLKEMSTIQCKSMIRSFGVDAVGRSIAIQTDDKTIYLAIQGQENLPGYIDRFVEIKEAEQKEPTEVKTDTQPQPVVVVETPSSTQISTEPKTEITQENTLPVSEPVVTPMIEVKQEPIIEVKQVKPTMNQLYGYWETGVAYKDVGYFVASQGSVAWLNLLLDTVGRYELQQGVVKAIDISRNGMVALLLEDRIELWDAKYMAENPKVTTYKGMKYSVANGEKVRFSRSGRKLLISGSDGSVLLIDADFTGQMALDMKLNVSAIGMDLSQTESFIIGTDQGELIWLSEKGILQREKVSQYPISEILYAYGDIYWADQDGSIGAFKKKSIRVDSGYVTSLYAPENGKNWMVIGTSIGNLYIYSNELSRLMGKANLGETPITAISGYMDNMVTISADRSIRSWNVSQISLLSTKPPFMNVLGMYSDQNMLGFVTAEGNNFVLDTVKGSLLSKRFDIGTNKVEQFIKKPPVVRIKDSFYAIQKHALSEKSYKAYENDKLNTADKFLLFWLGDLLKVIDLETGSVIRTLKFGEPNVVSWGTMVNKRLIFFLEGKMGIVNPYKPEDLLIIDVADENIAKIIEVFIYQDRLLIVDENGLIHQFGMIDSKFLTPINLSTKLTKVYYDTSRLLLIGYSGNTVIRYSPVDNNIDLDYVDGIIKDVESTADSFFVLTTEGVLWGKKF
jgi:WD40 repeat protein